MSKAKKNTKEDFDVVEYEEVILSDIDDDEPSAEACSSSSLSRCSDSTTEKNDILAFSDSCTSVKEQKSSDKSVKKLARKPARPIRLFSFTDHDIIDKFSFLDPAKKDLTLQLLNVVKSVNLRRKLKVDNNGGVVPNFYIIATNINLAHESRKVISMKSVDIVSLIKEIIHMIKTCVYREVDDIEIICDSPAIFLLKYVNVKNWDSSMNSVYVVTSEYLLPYLCKIRAAEEQERQSKLIAVKIMKDDKRKAKKTTPQTTKRQKTEQQIKNKSHKYEPVQNSDSYGNIPRVLSDENLVETILSKYLEQEAVEFFITQMKTADKYSNRYRWSDKDKFFALSLLRKNPTEYSILYENYCLPSDKTIDKFLKQLRMDKIDDIRIDDA